MTLVDKNISKENAGWNFEDIADDFDEHVRRSVPLYSEGHDLVCKLSDFFLPENATVTEIGTSTGVLAEKFLAHNASRSDITYVGIDKVESMLEKARERCAGDDRAQFRNDELLTCDLGKNSMVISYYLMQFIHPRNRQDLFNKIYESLEWGGALVLFEKVRAPDARFQDIAAQIYIEFKRDNGFSDDEIMGKQRSLKGILEPFSTQGNLDMLKRAGFVDVMTMMKSISFEGFLAIK
jgi:tRNA (cmo5U34)-methyltransferase